jgi:SAM-dependent methyltransferase
VGFQSNTFRRELVASLYDNIGRTYSGRRRSDPRIASSIEDAVDGCASILNVGAGAGSYEPRSQRVVAVEPSRTMIAQRPPGGAPVVQACAEALPFPDRSFDAVLGVLTVHHWNDFEVCTRFWLFDYFPELMRVDRPIFPSMERFADAFGSIEIKTVPIPADCRDGFLCAYWKRPRAYLDPLVRESISTFSKIGNVETQLACLERDIDSGAWDQRYSGLQGVEVLDLGYRIIIARGRANN